MFLGFQWDVTLAVFCRFTICICINTEHGKVTGMTRPHPVVCFTTKLTDRRGWSGYHTYIRIYFLIEKIEFISGIERKSLRNNSLFVCQVTFKIKIMSQLLKEYIAEWFGFGDFFRRDLGIDNIRNIFDTFDKCELQSRSREFFVSGSSPETISQIIVLNTTMLLDGGVATMVIGQNQTFGWDNFSGTSASEYTYGIFKRNSIRII